MKKLMLSLSIILMASTYAAHAFKSTSEARDTIFNTFNDVLQQPNIYDKSVSFNDLVKLGDDLNKHIMKKQGILLGTLSKRKGIGKKPAGEYGNVFDLWDIQVYSFFTQLINTIKTVRLAGSANNEAGKLLEIWQNNNVIENMMMQAKEIQEKAILSDKEKLAALIIMFVQNMRELDDKAVHDFQYLTK
jgi:hypothetical protein